MTLIGMGGIGKTRLALGVAERHGSGFVDGVWLVEFAALGGREGAHRVAPTLATMLGVRDQVGQPIEQTSPASSAQNACRSCWTTANRWLSRWPRLSRCCHGHCPQLHVMVTSREPLGLSGEIHWRVPSLSLTDTTSPASNDEIAAADSVQLFCDRARLVQVGFTLGDHNARTVAAICQQLDGVPLAIELAAARLNVLRPAQVLERLSNRFGLLLGNRLATRQQSLHATLDWSHGLLDDVERVLLRRLAAFVGGCILQAVEAVCGFDGLQADDVLDSLAGLADKSLVQVDANTARARQRYRFLETIRHYAVAKLEAEVDERAQLHGWPSEG